jgi:hypothetical protein
LREKHLLRVSENGLLGKIFGPKRDEVTGVWRRLHNEELNDLYCIPNVLGMIKSTIRWVEHVARRAERYIQSSGGEI